jgi:hypothetical protein
MYRISFHLKQNPTLRSLKLNQLCIKNLQFTTNYKNFQAIGRKELMQTNSYCLVMSRLRRVECCIDKNNPSHVSFIALLILSTSFPTCSVHEQHEGILISRHTKPRKIMPYLIIHSKTNMRKVGSSLITNL